MNEAACFNLLSWVWAAAALFSFLVLLFVNAPYGRYFHNEKGPMISIVWGWLIMEAPAPLLFLAFFYWGERQNNPVVFIFLLFWLFHYIHRAFVFPFRCRRTTRSMPLYIMCSAFFFNVVNTYLQGRYINTIGPTYDLVWLYDPRFIFGGTLFFIGFVINLRADSILCNLRKPGEVHYSIPYGNLFKYVSCPNYLGEIIEWIGWAIMTWSIPGLIFAFWTVANLGPRAIAHHHWYKKHFAGYPRERKALIPFIL